MGDGVKLGPASARRALTPSSASLAYTQAALDWLLGNGVADGLQVSVADDGRIQAASGQIIFRSSLWQLEAALHATPGEPPPSGEREDKIFLDVWMEEDVLVCDLHVAPGGVRPSPDPHDYLTLASIHRREGTGVSAADLHDLRPLVRSQARVTAEIGALDPKLVAAERAVAALQTQLQEHGRQLQSLMQRVQELETAPGTVLAFAGPSIPTGYLLCDGRPISRGGYARLYAAIGETWGAGDGSTTFNLPDLRGVFLRGVDEAGLRDPDVADRKSVDGRPARGLGSIQACATGMPRSGFKISEAGSHKHKDPTWNGQPGPYEVATLNRGPGGVDFVPSADTTEDGLHAHALAGGDRETRPLNIAIGYMIKA